MNPAFEAWADAKRLTTVDAPQVRIEPTPAELTRCATVAQLAVHDKSDDLRPTINTDSKVMWLAHRQRTRVAIPTAFAAAIIQYDLHGAARGRLKTQALAVLGAAVKQNLAGRERIERHPQIHRQTAAQALRFMSCRPHAGSGEGWQG